MEYGRPCVKKLKQNESVSNTIFDTSQYSIKDGYRWQLINQ